MTPLVSTSVIEAAAPEGAEMFEAGDLALCMPGASAEELAHDGIMQGGIYTVDDVTGVWLTFAGRPAMQYHARCFRKIRKPSIEGLREVLDAVKGLSSADYRALLDAQGIIQRKGAHGAR